ncbi:zinc finger, CCHC-type containing protein [Tanacetum coccineum]
MRDKNPIRTLRDYSRPSHEGYKNTIELPEGNNVVPLRFDTIRERTRLCLFQFSLRNQASNWLERLPAGSISTWEDLTTRFLAQFFPPGRTAKLRNDILMFQQHKGESLSKACTRFKDLLQKCEIDCAAVGKLRDKNADESSKIIENLSLYDHEGWNDSKEFVKPVKVISTSQSTSKTLDQRIIELEDQINFLLKGSRSTPRPNSTHIPQAYVEAVSSNPYPQNQSEPPKQNPFTFRERTSPYPQPQELGTTFKAREVDETNEVDDKLAKSVRENVMKNEEEERVGVSSSHAVGYYLKHRINRKLIEGLVENIRGPVYEAIPKKKITRKEDIGGKFEIPCNIGDLKHMNALVDQGSDMNFTPLSTYKKLTDERPAEIDIRLSLASHSYIYPVGIAEDALVDVAGFVYPVDFVILDIKEDEKIPFILGTPFLTIAKAVIKFDKGTITLRSGKSNMSFHRIHESLFKIER